MRNETDTLIESSYGETHRGTSPYERYPERASWTEFEIRERADGSRYTVVRHCHRWGGVYSFEAWVPK